MIDVKWANEERTLVQLDYSDPVASWGEYRQATEEAYALVKSQSHTVHLFHNSGQAKMPKGNAIAELQRAMNLLPANVGVLVMVIANPIARRIVEVTAKIYLRRKNFYFVGNEQEAYEKLKALDYQLN